MFCDLLPFLSVHPIHSPTFEIQMPNMHFGQVDLVVMMVMFLVLLRSFWKFAFVVAWSFALPLVEIGQFVDVRSLHILFREFKILKIFRVHRT
jgi:hypothetical protein